MEEKPRVDIFCDGACEPNPGRGGYGAVLRCNGHAREIWGPQDRFEEYENETSNRMELIAAIRALGILNRACEVKLHSDSNYLINTMNGLYRFGSNRDLWQILMSPDQPHTVEWIKLPRTDPRLQKPHELANMALKA